MCKLHKKQKSQAALEFLTTYGWAFLVILIMIVALSYFGILSPSKLLPNRCNFGPEIGCKEYTIAKNGLILRLTNNIAEPIVIDALSVSTDNSQLSCNSTIIGNVWKSGEVKDLPILCDITSGGLLQGEKGKLNIKLTYHSSSSNSAFAKDVKGEVFETILDNINTPLQSGPSTGGIWHLDEGSGTTATDSSGNGNTGTLFNNPAWVVGKKGSALSFNSINTFVQIPDSPGLDINNQITITVWANVAGLTGNADQDMIVNKEGIPYEIAVHDNTGPADGIHTCDPVNDQIVPFNFAFYLGGISGLPSHNCGWIDGGGPIPQNVWTHVAITYDGSKARTYINSVMKKEYTGLSGTIQVNTNAVRIGARGTSNPPPQTNGGALFKGTIDEVKIFNRALTPVEIFIDYST